MPIIIPESIPAYKTLTEEKVTVMTRARARSQDIRPIEILILNLMPAKIETEIQLLRLLSNSPLQVNITFLTTQSYTSKNVASAHLEQFYKTFSDIKDQNFDGMIVTGAPVEHLEFTSVKYWDELVEILDYAQAHVTSTFYICWAASAALYHFYDIPKIKRTEKCFGVFEHTRLCGDALLLKGLDDTFFIPHSSHSRLDETALQQHPNLQILAASEHAGSAIIRSRDNRSIFVTGHLEYDRDTLEKEYQRDTLKGLPIAPPHNYTADAMVWKSTATIVFANWLNYYVYQVTPYGLNGEKL